MSQRKIVETKDGSSTLFSEQTGDYYHSLHGAETESSYVFIEKGLEFRSIEFKNIRLLEVGMGTGLNLALTYKWFLNHSAHQIDYTALEPFPLDMETINGLSFDFLSDNELKKVFEVIHTSKWNERMSLHPDFSLLKSTDKLQDLKSEGGFNLVYYDAFGPTYQGEMWELNAVEKVASIMCSGGVLVTYCAQGQFRRNLQEWGFEVERLDGPPGKRQMIRAIKS